MEEGKINPKNHTILIGINFYPIKPLNSCVRDVQEIKKYLDMLPDPVNTKMLTASSSDISNPSRPVEDQKLWSIYDNVISSIKNINSSVQPGDFVYIHFSGYGTSIKPSNELSSASIENLALVLLNETSDLDTRYLQGSELIQLLSDMVDKKLMVTFVLDCCQSGNVMRNDSSIRFLEYNPLIDAVYSSSHVQYLNPTYRYIVIFYDWLRNLYSFIIIAVFGPHEVAREIKLNNGQYHGALFYFLFEAWKEFGGSRAKQHRIYEYLSTRVRDLCTGQNPIRYKTNDQGFFGDVRTDINQASVLIVRKPDKSLQLQADRIHGICNSDQFSLYPFDDVNSEFKFTETPIIAEITDVRSLVSDLKLLNTTSTRVKTDWVAIPLTCLSLWKFPIHIQPIPLYLNNWEAAQKEQQSLNIINSNETSEQTIAFRIAQINKNDYEIKNECSNIIEQSITTHYERKNINYILDIIEYIARFKLVNNIINEVLADPTNLFR